MASFYSGRLLSSLLCHWLVGRAGWRGSLNVVPLGGALKWAVGLAEVDMDGGSESALLWWLSYCCMGRYVDWCADRGRRAVGWNGGLNRGKRCDDMWVFPQVKTKIVILGIQRLQQLQPVSSHAKTFAQNTPNTWLRHLQFPALAMCWLLRVPDKRFSHTLDSFCRWPRPAISFRSAQAVTLLEFHVPLTNCFVRRWFCVVHGPKPPLHRHNWLSFGKFQDTERFLLPTPRHVSSRLPPSAETCKYATAPSTQKNLERFSTYWYAPSCCVCHSSCAAEFGSSGGKYELPCS